MPEHFEVFKDEGGKYRWRLNAANGRKIATSGESFASAANARRAAEGVKRTAEKADPPKPAARRLVARKAKTPAKQPAKRATKKR